MDYKLIRASRISGQLFNSPNVFVETTMKANQLGAINLGQGAATFEIPDFYFSSF
jgi:hypothetical protein